MHCRLELAHHNGKGPIGKPWVGSFCPPPNQADAWRQSFVFQKSSERESLKEKREHNKFPLNCLGQRPFSPPPHPTLEQEKKQRRIPLSRSTRYMPRRTPYHLNQGSIQMVYLKAGLFQALTGQTMVFALEQSATGIQTVYPKAGKPDFRTCCCG